MATLGRIQASLRAFAKDAAEIVVGSRDLAGERVAARGVCQYPTIKHCCVEDCREHAASTPQQRNATVAERGADFRFRVGKELRVNCDTCV